jgi:hypothetical protein
MTLDPSPSSVRGFFESPRGTFTALGLALVAAYTCVTLEPAHAADEPMLQQLASCQDSWLEWKENNPHMTQLVNFMKTNFAAPDDGGAFVPKGPISAMGMKVARVYPQTVGMGVGFSMIVNAKYDDVRRSFEKQLGKPMTCSVSEGTPACELKLGEKKTAVLMTDDPRAATTLVGCYYYYEK